jgi:hypothetical protein
LDTLDTKPHKRNCPVCQKELGYKDIYERNRSVKNNLPCKPCSSILKNHKGYYQEIEIAWFNAKVRRAKQRSYEFTITIEDIWDIYIAQDKVCALSGVPIDFKGTASLDRVDNSQGYVRENIQIVHKDVNYMKYTYSQDYFIKMCNLVASKHNVERDEEIS